MILLLSGNARGILQGVLHVPKLAKILISVSVLTLNGCTVEFGQNSCTIKSSSTGETIATAVKENNLYRLLTEARSEAHTASPKGVFLELWHQSLGHILVNTIKKMQNKDLVTGLHISSSGELPFYEACIAGKQHRLPFPKEAK